MPDPFHQEVNNWQHVLNLIYTQSVRQNSLTSFIDTLISTHLFRSGLSLIPRGHQILELRLKIGIFKYSLEVF